MCDVVGCLDDILCWVDGVAHCARHLEDAWEQWQAVGIYPRGDGMFEPLHYRQVPRKSIYAEQVDRLQQEQNSRRKS